MRKRKIKAALLALLFTGPFGLLVGCGRPADTVSHNLSVSADNFEVNRRIVFINGITDKYLMEIQGYCSLGNEDTDRKLSVTCKVSPGNYKKHFLGLSDNVTFFVEQLEPAKASEDRYRVVFRPQTIIPDIDFKIGSTNDEPGTK